MKQKQLLKPLFLLCALLVGGLNSLWAQDVYSTCLFGSSYNSKGVSSYADTWTTTNGGFTWTIANGNNNNNGWLFVKFGSKKNASVGTITTSAAYTEAITKVDLTIDAITADNINSIKLYTSSNNSTWTEAGSFNKASGKQSVSLSSPTKNLYYKIEFDCAIGSSNGFITVSKVEYYYEGNTSDTRTATTTTIDDAGITNTNVFDGTAAGSLSASVAAGETSIDATVTWSGDNDNVATINESTGVVTLVAAGTVTFTATYAGNDNYKPSSATYEMTVTNDDPNAPGTETNPYTVAQAIEYINTLGSSTSPSEIYVSGIVSQVDSYSSTYKSITYWISDDGKTTTQMEVYSGKGLNGADFSSKDDLAVGDIVTVKGYVKNYNSTPEFDKNNQLVSLQREKRDAEINVPSVAQVAFGDIYTLNQDDIKGGDVTVTSSNTAVATVDGLVITPVAVGTTTITIETEENKYYNAGSATFTLTVTAPEGSASTPSGDVLFNETFDQLEGSGGRDDTFTGQVGTSATDKLDETWAVIGQNGANKCIKLGTGNAAGTVTTGNIALRGNGTLTFSAAGWGTGTNTITVEATGAKLSGDTEVTLTNGEWKNYTVSITNATGEVAITFSMKRGFLDDVKVVEAPEPTAPTVTLAASGYASYCCEYPLDLDQLDNNKVKAYIVTDVNGEDVTFTQLTGKIKGGVPFILYGTPNFECQLTYTESDVVPSGNMLVGTLAPTYVTAGNIYGLSGGQFKKINTGVMKANKAYLATTSSAPALNIIFDENGATGIRSIDNGQLTIDNVYYDLSGRRIEKPTKGLYIVNGKKVILK